MVALLGCVADQLEAEACRPQLGPDGGPSGRVVTWCRALEPDGPQAEQGWGGVGAVGAARWEAKSVPGETV